MSVAGIKQITNPVDILDRDELEKELHDLGTMRSKADAIVSHMTKSIKANRDENPAYYDSFSKRIKDALEEYKNRVITEAEYLSKLKSIMEDYRKGTTNISYPEKIKGNVHAQAFYGVITAILDDVMDIITSTLKDITKESDNRQGRLLFKIAVELSMLANIIAGERKFPPHQIADLRAECINEVKRLNGTLTFEEAVEWQNSYSR